MCIIAIYILYIYPLYYALLQRFIRIGDQVWGVVDSAIANIYINFV